MADAKRLDFATLSAETRVLEHPVVQRELSAQAEDLAMLATGAGATDVIRRAKNEALARPSV